jgi:small subunit ribosomal protein S16
MRLRRQGAKKKPFYRVVVADSLAPRDGRFIEQMGYFNPIKDPAVVKLDEEKIRAWLDKGVTPSDTVRTLLKNEGILKRHADREPVPTVVEPVAEEPVAEEPVAEEAVEEVAEAAAEPEAKEPADDAVAEASADASDETADESTE